MTAEPSRHSSRTFAPARWLTLSALLALLAGCTLITGSRNPNGGTEPLVLGADISALDAPGRGRWAPLPVYQDQGVASDEMSILYKHGWTAFRVRVFVSPVRDAPNNTLEAAIPLARRIKAAGAKFLLCIHLSDTWADPQHQEIPVAWRSLDMDGLEKQVEAYTTDVIRQLKAAGAMPDWVQVGNEITRGTLWPLAQVKFPGSKEHNPVEPYDDARHWDQLTRVLKAGIRGVKAAAGDTPPRIAIHIDKGADWTVTQWFFDHLAAARVEYDIIAQSFYPEWNHGTLAQLQDNMVRCAARYGKDFAVVETGYGRSHKPDNTSMFWPETPEGRLQFMADIINTVKQAPRGIAVMYWAPEREAWNDDGTPGPVVSVMDQLEKLKARPASKAPPAGRSLSPPRARHFFLCVCAALREIRAACPPSPSAITTAPSRRSRPSRSTAKAGCAGPMATRWAVSRWSCW